MAHSNLKPCQLLAINGPPNPKLADNMENADGAAHPIHAFPEMLKDQLLPA